MRGIEAACWGQIGSAIDLRTSKSGRPFANFNLAVIVGQDEDGKQLTQWLRVAIFGELAQEFSERAAKGDRAYVEGQLTLNTWADKSSGATKSGINLTAWRCKKCQPSAGIANFERRATPCRRKLPATRRKSSRKAASRDRLRASDPLPF